MYWGHKSDTLISIPIHLHKLLIDKEAVCNICALFFEFENTMHTKVLYKVGQIVDAKQQNCCGKKLVTLALLL